jgi:hypothetical protein
MYILYIDSYMDCTLAPGPTRLGSPCTKELAREAKSAAYREGLTLSEWIKQAVEEKLGRIRVTVTDKVPETEPVVSSEKLSPCDVCGADCVQWGPKQRHCTKCSRNFLI